ncbi:MAG TPA: glycoside hydrolase family 9 protein [Micromonosporaceae bacterium]|nr:glycoside hydrolase family 9 protein [Micromonosporaceae bacterium]
MPATHRPFRAPTPRTIVGSLRSVELVRRSAARLRLAAAVATGAAFVAGAALVAVDLPARAAAAPPYNYGEALQKAVWFYDAQRLGRLPADNRVSWRGDSFLTDGADVGLDLTGGFADAGDTIKATFPLVHSLTTLAWGMLESRQGYTATGQERYLLSNLRWGMDYLVRANPAPNRLVTEVGDPGRDHQLWAAAEVQTYPRTTYLMTAPGCWGADLADSTAATFAAASLVFRADDPAYAAKLLTHAKQLYATTEANTKSKYDDCTPIMKGFYNSWSGYGDELVWGSLWLYKATGDTAYLERARAYYPGMGRMTQDPTSPIKYNWTYDWDDKTASSVILMAQLTNDAQALRDATNWADYNAGAGVNGTRLPRSPGGQAFYGPWGSLRYSSGAAMLALVLADSGRLDPARSTQLHDFAVKQVNYILGDNPSGTSYLVGFGPRPVTRPHHRTAHGPWSNHHYEPVENRHTLYGALIGGPKAPDDSYGPEDRNDFQKAEVALDYNAAMTSALARLAGQYGGTPLPSFPPVETPSDELFVTASLNQAGSNFFEIKSLWYNHTAWPARFTENISLRYYFTLDPGVSPADVRLQTAYAQCASPTGPTQYQGSTYYVTISCAGQRVGPVGQSESRRENQFRVTFPGPHDYTRDWSYAGVSENQATPTRAPHITLHDGARLVYGSPPGAAEPSPATPAPTSPAATTAPPTTPPPTTPSVGTVRVQYRNNDSAPTDSQIRPGLTLFNGGSVAVPLAQVTLRYYFTAEPGSTAYHLNCDYARIGCANVTSRVVALATPVVGADRYLEVGFAPGAGSVQAGGTLGEIQLRLNKSDWSAFNESGDYSFGTATSFADTTTVPAYVNGALTWGAPPR